MCGWGGDEENDNIFFNLREAAVTVRVKKTISKNSDSKKSANALDLIQIDLPKVCTIDSGK